MSFKNLRGNVGRENYMDRLEYDLLVDERAGEPPQPRIIPKDVLCG